MTRGPESRGYSEARETNNSVTIRPFEDKDYAKAVEIAQSNFRTTYSQLFPKDVIDGYIAANRIGDLRHALKTDGTEAYVAEANGGDVSGFCLIRYNPYTRRDYQGELELRRLHVDGNNRGQRIGTKLFDVVEERGNDIGVEMLVSLASGSSRPFFEQNGWTGRTELNQMPKRKTSALVFAAQKRIAPEPIPLYERPSHVVYAGESKNRENYISELIGEIDSHIVVFGARAEEDPIPDVYEAARSKAFSVSLDVGRHSPLIVASDVRNELLRYDPNNQHKYDLVDRGKPRGANPLEEVRSNFELLLDTAKATRRPAPYIIRAATYLHNPTEPENDSSSENDTSIWLTREALEELSTERGLRSYRDEVYDKYSADITGMSSGFALPVFLERGYVAGINGHPLDNLPRKQDVIDKSIHTALVGVDEKLIRHRLGIL